MSYLYTVESERYLYNLQEIEEFLLFDEHGLVRGFNYQEQIYVIFS